MNWLDIGIIIFILIPTFIGFSQGIIKAVLSLAGLILGVILAGRYHALLAEQLTFISQVSLANVVAFAIIVLVVMIAATVTAAVLKWAVTAIMLGWVNRLGGAALGFVLGAVFCSAALAMWVKFLGISAPIAQSALAGFLLDTFPVILALLPAEFGEIHGFFR